MDTETQTATIETTSCVPQVSIGMPVYNGEAFIREALDALLAQTFTDFELIISDNASTDGTEAICREYALRDKRVRYVRQAKNCGAIANFQFVLKEAVSEYFMWAAADDYWAPTFLTKIVDAHKDRHIYINIMSRYISSSRRWSSIKSYKIKKIEGISSSNPEERIIGFLVSNPAFQPANLIYGVWKTHALKCLISFISETTSSYSSNGWDLLLITLALKKSPFFQIDDVLFDKRYKTFPTHHAFDVFYSLVRELFGLKKALLVDWRPYFGDYHIEPYFSGYPCILELSRSTFYKQKEFVNKLKNSFAVGFFKRD